MYRLWKNFEKNECLKFGSNAAAEHNFSCYPTNNLKVPERCCSANAAEHWHLLEMSIIAVDDELIFGSGFARVMPVRQMLRAVAEEIKLVFKFKTLNISAQK